MNEIRHNLNKFVIVMIEFSLFWRCNWRINREYHEMYYDHLFAQKRLSFGEKEVLQLHDNSALGFSFT